MNMAKTTPTFLVFIGVFAGPLLNLSQATAAHFGEAHYQHVCSECHDRNAKKKQLAKGAPRLGDRTAWESRLNKGIDNIYKTLMDNEHHGKKDDVSWENVNPLIWRENLSESQIRMALEYMFSEADN